MMNSHADLAQGVVKDFPRRFEMKHRLFSHRHGTPFRFTLITDGVEQEVELIDAGSHGTPGDGSWYTELTVCPVETIDTLRGARIIHVDVDASGLATFY